MKYFALKIAYYGGAFSGFAPQKQAKIHSVSETLQNTLKKLGINSEILGAGRTDKGVHSLGMIVRICAGAHWTPQRLAPLLAKKLYPNIMLRAIWEVDSSFHPRFGAKARRYYYVFSPKLTSPFVAPFVAYERIGDIKIIRQCLAMCIGTHNFALFYKQGSSIKSTSREIYTAYLRIKHYRGQTYYIVCIEGNAFLRAQIRLLVGAILATSRNEISLQNFTEQLLAKKRHYSQPVSPQGLYFAKAHYENLPPKCYLRHR